MRVARTARDTDIAMESSEGRAKIQRIIRATKGNRRFAAIVARVASRR